MPLPYFVDGNYENFIESLHALKNHGFENIIQGHGEVILRGEIESKIDSDIEYLQAIRRHVEIALQREDGETYLSKIDVEKCGKSRIPLNGGVQDLHRGNLRALYQQLANQQPSANNSELA
jgi:hypothetical protein